VVIVTSSSGFLKNRHGHHLRSKLMHLSRALHRTIQSWAQRIFSWMRVSWGSNLSFISDGVAQHFFTRWTQQHGFGLRPQR